jgi:hypothetical protein
MEKQYKRRVKGGKNGEQELRAALDCVVQKREGHVEEFQVAHK